MHAIYDALLADLPGGTVRSAVIAPVWTCVRTDEGTGIAMTPTEEYRRTRIRGRAAGMNITDLAAHVTSWNVHESALGMATINSCVNRTNLLPDDGRVVTRDRDAPGVFGGLEALLLGKKVAIVGHGPHVERLRDACELTVLERRPREGDLPDPACEYVLPDQDFVFITGSAFANKTLPRLVELSRDAFTAIWGPSTPMSPALFDLGVDALLGTVIDDGDEVARIVGEGGYIPDFPDHATQVSWFRDAAVVQAIRDGVGRRAG